MAAQPAAAGGDPRQGAGLDFDPDLQTRGRRHPRHPQRLRLRRRRTPTPGAEHRHAGQSALRPPRQRPARFLRIEKAVSIGDDDLGFPDIDNAAFGTVTSCARSWATCRSSRTARCRCACRPTSPSSSRFSTRTAGVFPASPQLAAAAARRDTRVQRLPPAGHGADRTAGTVRRVGGRPATGPFPDTRPAFPPISARPWRRRARASSCQTDSAARRSQRGRDLHRRVDRTRRRRRRRMRSSPTPTRVPRTRRRPTSAGLPVAWSSTCRIIINYVHHIHPLWFARRWRDGVTVLADNTCTNCHRPAMPPTRSACLPGQLDLTDGDSNDQPLHKAAYRELLFADNEQEVIWACCRTGGAGGIDPVTGQPTSCTGAGAGLAGRGQRAWFTRFFSRFAAGGTHAGPPDRREVASDLRVGRYWCPVFQQSVRSRCSARLRTSWLSAVPACWVCSQRGRAPRPAARSCSSCSSPRPYLELHEGPGRGYPVTQVVPAAIPSTCSTGAPNGSACARNAASRAGRSERECTLLADGSAFTSTSATVRASSHHWEMGVLAGDYGGARWSPPTCRPVQ